MGPSGPSDGQRANGPSAARGAPSSADQATPLDGVIAGFLGVIVGLAPLAWAVAAVLVFGVLVPYEAWWIVLLIGIPPGAIALAAAAPQASRDWRIGLRVGLVISAFGSLMLGVYGLILVASIAVGYVAGAAIARSRRAPQRPVAPARRDPLDWTHRSR